EVPQGRRAEIDGRVRGGSLPGARVTAARENDAEGHQHEPEHEQGGEDEEERYARVGVDGGGARDLEGPEPEEREGGGCGEGGPHEGRPVVAFLRGEARS